MALINNSMNDIPGIITLLEETDAVNSEKDFRKQLEITNQLSWSGSPRWSTFLCDGSPRGPLLPPLCVRVCIQRTSLWASPGRQVFPTLKQVSQADAAHPRQWAST